MTSDEAVEAAAKAMWDANPLSSLYNTWEFLEAGGNFQTVFRRQARAALEAAAPHMLAEAWDEGWDKRDIYDIAFNPYRTQETR